MLTVFASNAPVFTPLYRKFLPPLLYLGIFYALQNSSLSRGFPCFPIDSLVRCLPMNWSLPPSGTHACISLSTGSSARLLTPSPLEPCQLSIFSNATVFAEWKSNTLVPALGWGWLLCCKNKKIAVSHDSHSLQSRWMEAVQECVTGANYPLRSRCLRPTRLT